MRSRPLLAIALLLVGWVLGFMMRGDRLPRPEERRVMTAAPNAPFDSTLTSAPPAAARPSSIEDALAGMDAIVPETFDEATIQALFAELAREPDEIQQLRRAVFLTSRIRPEDLPRALALVPGRDVDNALKHLLVHRWAQADPRAAAHWLATTKDNGVSDRMVLGVIARSMAERDVDAALTWAQEHGDKDDRERALGGVLLALRARGPMESLALICERVPEFAKGDELPRMILQLWGQESPDRTAEALLTLPETNRRREALIDLGRQRAAGDPGAALTWAAQLPDGARDRVMAGVLRGWAKDDPQKAAAQLDRVAVGSEARAAAAHWIGEFWAERDIEGAIVWAGALEDEPAQVQAAKAIGSRFKPEQAVRQVAWMETLAPGKVRDAAVAEFVEKARDRDPEGAAMWALTITDAPEREQRLLRVARTWKEKDPAAARAWLANAGAVPEAVRKLVLTGK